MSVMRYSRKLLREAFVVRGTKKYPCGKQYSRSGGMMQCRSYVIVADRSIEHVPLTLHRSVNVAVQSIHLVEMIPFLQHSLSPTEIDGAAKAVDCVCYHPSGWVISNCVEELPTPEGALWLEAAGYTTGHRHHTQRKQIEPQPLVGYKASKR